jgi:short-subunit dehydrogenase
LAFTGHLALVTGGGSGLGQIAAVQLAQQGAKVAVVDVNETGMKETANRGGAGIASYVCDVADAEAVAETVARIESDQGPVDRLFHAAGIMPAGRILDTPVERLLLPMQVNYFGTVHVCTSVLPRMLARGTGDVVLFGSITGYSWTTNMAGYSASKAAVNAFGEILIHEHRNSGLRMILVCPSAVRTPLLDQAVQGGPKALVDSVTAGRAADPAKILTQVERGLERGTTVLVPGEARLTYLLRRLSPALMWRLVHCLNKD